MKDTDRFNIKFSLYVDFDFEADHKLLLVPKGHKCGRWHGHSYGLRVHAAGFLTRKNEWVTDYADIKSSVDPIVESLDHFTLNDVMGEMETTAENLAFWIGQKLAVNPWLHAVEIFETKRTSVKLVIR